MPPASRLGDKAHAPADAHGCKSCAHPVTGPSVVGSPDVLINGKPAMRLGDAGIHSGCCGPNTWQAVMGSATVLINGMPAVRLGDMTQHCGGVGKLIEGSADVMIGDQAGGGGGAARPSDSSSKNSRAGDPIEQQEPKVCEMQAQDAASAGDALVAIKN